MTATDESIPRSSPADVLPVGGLAWKSHLRPVVLTAHDLVVLSEDGHHLLHGPEYARVAELLLEARYSKDEICQQFERDGIPSFPGLLALEHLRALGLVEQQHLDLPIAWAAENLAFYDSQGHDTPVVIERLRRSRVVVQNAGGAGAPLLRQALEAAHILLAEEPSPDDLPIVVVDDYLDPRLEKVNRHALERGNTWMVVKLVGTVPWLGPIFVPGATGCWECLAQRLRLNRQTETLIAERLGPEAKVPAPRTRSSLALAAQVASLVALNWLTDPGGDLEGGLLSLDLKTNQLVRHVLHRRPQCPACGTPDGARPHREPPVLDASRKAHMDGRSESAATTLTRYQTHVSPITGVVRSLSESRAGGHLYVSAAHTFPMHHYDFRVLRDNLLGRSGGKGFDPAQVRVSALCEALERYSGMWHGEEAVVAARSRQQLGDDALNPTDLLGFSLRQYAERNAWNETNDDPHGWVPPPFDDERAVDWVPVWSLTDSGTRLAPAAYCYYGHPDIRYAFCASDSNGCAAGGTFTEAVAHGLLELIERDGAAIWWYNRLARPAVDLDSFNLPIVEELRELFDSQGRCFWALDLTNDVGVPVVAAVSARLDGPAEDVIYGFGADFDPSAAVTKALLEMNQSLFSVLSDGPGRPTRYRTDRPSSVRWFRTATRVAMPYLVPDPAREPRRGADFGWPAHDDWQHDVAKAVERLHQVGVETFVLDQTRADVGLPVARVIAPGLCHIWRRAGCRRLTEVPVAMGWTTVPTPEEDLNPWLVYF